MLPLSPKQLTHNTCLRKQLFPETYAYSYNRRATDRSFVCPSLLAHSFVCLRVGPYITTMVSGDRGEGLVVRRGIGCQSLFWNHLLPTLKPKQWRKMWDPKVRAYFKPYLQLHKTWQSANWQCSNCSFYNVGLHFDFTTTRILISCTLKYALSKVIDDLIVNNRFSFSMIILFVVLVNSKKWRRRTCVWTPIFRRCIFCILQLCNCKIRPTYRLILWNISNFR